MPIDSKFLLELPTTTLLCQKDNHSTNTELATAMRLNHVSVKPCLYHRSSLKNSKKVSDLSIKATFPMGSH